MQNILEDCVNCFTNIKLNKDEITTDEDKEKYWNKLNVMREILNIVGLLKNSLAHNQPIYNFNVKESANFFNASIKMSCLSLKY